MSSGGSKGMKIASFVLAAALAAGPAVAQVAPMTDDDPYIWLEDKDGAKALA